MGYASYGQFIKRFLKVFPIPAYNKIESIGEDKFTIILSGFTGLNEDGSEIEWLPTKIQMVILTEIPYIIACYELSYLYIDYLQSDMSVERFVDEYVFNGENSLVKKILKFHNAKMNK